MPSKKRGAGSRSAGGKRAKPQTVAPSAKVKKRLSKGRGYANAQAAKRKPQPARRASKALTELDAGRWRAKFLAALRDTGAVTISAQRAGINRSTVHRHRELDAEFEEQVVEALEAFADGLELVAVKRARKKSDALLARLLEANRPEKYTRGLRVEGKMVVWDPALEPPAA